MTVYWMVWDAAADWVVRRLCAEGALPGVTAMRARGARAAARPPTPNCQTPPSLATLFTGRPASRHGVSGYTVPSAPTATATTSGFDPSVPVHPMVWQQLGTEGVRSAFVHAPWVFAADGTVPPWVDVAVEAYPRRLVRHGAVRLPAGMPGTTFTIGTAGFRARPAGRKVEVSGESGHHVLDVDGSWATVRIRPDAGVRMRAVTTSAGTVLTWTGAWRSWVAGSNRELSDALAALPGFVGESPGSIYREGQLGQTLPAGGDGRAEQHLLAGTRTVTESFRAATQEVLARHRAELVVVYLPMTDDIGHELIGYCDPVSGRYDPSLAARLWPVIRDVYEQSDGILRSVLERATGEDTVILSADHGIAGVTHVVHLNDALVRAGLAVAGEDGRIDPHRSAVFYHPAGNGLLVTGQSATDDGALRRAVEVIAALRCPDTGRPVLLRVCDREGEDVDPDGAARAYVVLRDDFQPSADVGAATVVRRTAKSGGHTMNTGDPRLHATLAVTGPGVAAGSDLGVVDNTFAARTALAVLSR